MPQRNGETGAGVMAGVPEAASRLGLAGLLPFAVGALAALVLGGEAGEVARGLLAGYGAVILSFMGGCRWGFAAAGLGEGPSYRLVGLSVLPALWGWVALAVSGAAGLAMLAAGFAALLWADIALTREGGAPAWWPALRWPLSLGAIAALLAGAIA